MGRTNTEACSTAWFEISSFPRSRHMRERSCMREHMQSVCYTAFCTALTDVRSRSHSLASSMTFTITRVKGLRSVRREKVCP